MRRPRIVLSVTSPLSALLLRGQLAMLRRAGADVTLLSAPGERSVQLAEREQARFVPVDMQREISPREDLRTFVEVKRVLAELAPDLVNAGTPKAGLLVTTAAAAARVPARVFTLRGLRSATMTGPGKYVMRAAEAASCRFAHRVICISPSLRDEAISLGVVNRARAVVLGAGSSNGIDVHHFQRTDEAVAAGRALRARHGIEPGALVVAFVGRLHRDKGVFELIRAFTSLELPDAVLLLAGPAELDAAEEAELARAAATGRVKLLGMIDDVRAVYATSELVVLPSWREGFGNVVIEAAAMGVPVVASNVTGCRDAVADGETGTLVPPRDEAALARALHAYAIDPELRKRHGDAGRRRAVASFSNEAVWAGQVGLYNELLRDLPVRPLELP